MAATNNRDWLINVMILSVEKLPVRRIGGAGAPPYRES